MSLTSKEIYNSARPLDIILGKPEETALRESVRNGRSETVQRFPLSALNLHQGWHSVATVNDYLINEMKPLAWKSYQKSNQLRFLAPDNFSTDRITLIHLTGELIDEDQKIFRVNRKGERARTRFLIDSQGRLVDGGQTALFPDKFKNPTYDKVIFLISKVKRQKEDDTEHAYLFTYLAYPAKLNRAGTILSCDDFELIDSIDLITLNTVPNIPASVISEPELFDLDG